jgi:hypothetical protein
MDNIFSGEAWEEFRKNGFVKPGIALSPTTVKALRQLLHSPRTDGSPWSSFFTHADGRARDIQYGAGSSGRIRNWMTQSLRTLVAKHVPSLIHRRIAKRNLYSQSTFGTSNVLKTVLDELMAQGLARYITGNHLLVAHDIFLENSSDQNGFGFHDDGWSLEIFYNTDDDLSIYIQLQDVDESTGGRLLVEPDFETSARFRHRNRMIKEFSELCEKVGCVDDEGYASREAVLRSKTALEGFRRLRSERDALPRPKPQDLCPIDARAGEVTLFANLHFHDNEPWASHNTSKRAVYIVRLMPTYDVRLRPPRTFLDGAPCNRFILDPINQRVLPLDPDTNPLRRYGVPLPQLADA